VLARRRREPPGRLGPLALTRQPSAAAWPCPGRPGRATTAPPLPPLQTAAALPARAPVPRRVRRLPPHTPGRSGPQLGQQHRRRGAPPRLPGRAPAARAGGTEEGGGTGAGPASLTGGPRRSAPLPFMFYLLFLFLYFG